MALFHIQFHSEALRMASALDVIIPQKSSSLIGMTTNAEEKCKTLYLLHGLSDDQTIWQRRTSIERYAAEKNLAVVMPAAGKSWYTDMAHGDAYQTYITKEVPAYCRSVFRCMSDKREDNFVAGLSMGGYGALKMALSSPDEFAGVACFSGALDVANNRYTTREYWSDIFGDLDAIKGSKNDVYALIKKAAESGKALPKVYMWCGLQDFLLEDSRRAKELFEKYGYDFTYVETDGDHSWFYWDREIQNAIKLFM
ncbi:MAG: esterase family protein [Ruminococcaceae bacterium]|nr:esterase family protein [Oscillospiraceae bacterium]